MHSSRMRTARLLTNRGGVVLHSTPILYGTPLMEPPPLRMAVNRRGAGVVLHSTPILYGTPLMEPPC